MNGNCIGMKVAELKLNDQFLRTWPFMLVSYCQNVFSWIKRCDRCFVNLKDTDECSTGSPCRDPAVNHTSCQNTEGGFACVCVEGFVLNNVTGVCEGE